MAIAELVLKYLDTLVWPVVTVVLVWMLRAQIRQAFGRLTRLETPAGTLEFEAEARAVRDEADDLRAPVVEGPADEGFPCPIRERCQMAAAGAVARTLGRSRRTCPRPVRGAAETTCWTWPSTRPCKP